MMPRSLQASGWWSTAANWLKSDRLHSEVLGSLTICRSLELTVNEETTVVHRALVTGASSGIGAAFAERLARDGYDLVLVARRVDRLKALAERLQASYRCCVEVLAADLSQPADLRRVEEKVAGDATLDLLVNNAGFANATPFSELDVDVIGALIQVQVVALVRLTRAALPGMVANRRGAIINLSSIAAFTPCPEPFWTVYCATKAFVNTFTRGVQEEVRETGVKLQALCPAFVPTEIFDQGGFSSQKPDWVWMMPEVVVDASLTGMRLGEVICFPSLDDPALLQQLDELRQAISDCASTGAPAARYIN
jgi:uncharacterized protein